MYFFIKTRRAIYFVVTTAENGVSRLLRLGRDRVIPGRLLPLRNSKKIACEIALNGYRDRQTDENLSTRRVISIVIIVVVSTLDATYQTHGHKVRSVRRLEFRVRPFTLFKLIDDYW